MIVFSSLQIRRGVRVLLDNASATINPGQKVGLVGKNGCGKSTLLALLKNEISADAGSFTLPGTWQLAWVNQETPALPQPAIEYVIDGDRDTVIWKRSLTTPTNVTTDMLSPPYTASWTPSTHGPFARAPPACFTASASLTISWNVRSATFPAAGECALTWPRR
ncbi:glutathione ABC transporter ATP-binding protein [Salmonella enterica subsp. diarizonae]|nr:glutathione ABC transporter ATP-binding protein [Salmonella enterica subsp. diarizonae]